MFGTMQHWPLLAHKILDHAAIQHPNRAVISRSVEGPIHRTTYGAMHKRSRQVAPNVSPRTAHKLGDRVATLAWNTWRQHGGVVRAFGHWGDLSQRLIRGCFPIKSPGSSMMRPIGCCLSTSPSSTGRKADARAADDRKGGDSHRCGAHAGHLDPQCGRL